MNQKNKPKKTTTQKNKKTELNKSTDDKELSLNGPFDFVKNLISFDKLNRKQKISYILTLLILILIPLFKISIQWINKTSINKKITDTFISAPNQESPFISIALLSLKNDKVDDNEISIQELFLNRVQNPYLHITKYRSFIDPSFLEKAHESAQKYANKYDIVIWGSSIWRDESKKYRIFFSTKNSNIDIPEFSISDCEFPQDVYNNLYALIPALLLAKVEKIGLLDDDNYNEKTLKQFKYLFAQLINEPSIFDSFSTEDKQKIYQKAAEICFSIGKAQNSIRDLKKSIEYIKNIVENNSNYYSSLVLLGKVQYYLALQHLSLDNYNEGITLLNESIKILDDASIKIKTLQEVWADSAKKFSPYLPKEMEIRINEDGKTGIHILTPIPNEDDIEAIAVLPIMIYENASINWAMCQDVLGLALYELGIQTNDLEILSRAKSVFDNSITEKTRKHYLPGYDNWSMYGMEEISLPYCIISEDTADLVKAYLEVQKKVLNKTSKQHLPITWANRNYDIAYMQLMLGKIYNNLYYFKEAIKPCSSSMKIFSEQYEADAWYHCQRILCEVYDAARILSRNTPEKKRYIKKSIEKYSILLDYCLKMGLTSQYADNMLSIAWNIFDDYLDRNDKDNTRNYIKVFVRYASANNKSYATPDGHATLELANGIIQYLQYLIFEEISILQDASQRLDVSLEGFTHPCVIPKKVIAYYISGIIMQSMWKTTQEDNDLLKAKMCFEKCLEEDNKNILKGYIVIPFTFKDITNKINEIIISNDNLNS